MQAIAIEVEHLLSKSKKRPLKGADRLKGDLTLFIER